MKTSDLKFKLRQAVILAGGQGTRLRPLTLTTPKPLIPVSGKPFVEHMVEHLAKNGIEEIVLLTGYLAEQFQEYFGNSKWGVNFKYSESDLEAESGTRVRNAAHLLDEQFLLLYGDNFWPIPVQNMEDFHIAHGKLITMGVFNNDGTSEYGLENNVTVKDGMILYYGVRGTGKNAVDIGTFVVSKRALDYLPGGNSVFQRDITAALVHKGEIAAFCTDTPYCYITDVASIGNAEKYLNT